MIGQHNRKLGKQLEQLLHKRAYPSGQDTQNILNLISYQGDAN
jgi:hypothetical protein